MQNAKVKMQNDLPINRALVFCSHCGRNPGKKEGNDNLWNVFYDADTSEYVCRDCVKLHYEKKRKGPWAGMFSEMPVVITPPPLAGSPLRSDLKEGETFIEIPSSGSSQVPDPLVGASTEPGEKVPGEAPTPVTPDGGTGAF